MISTERMTSAVAHAIAEESDALLLWHGEELAVILSAVDEGDDKDEIGILDTSDLTAVAPRSAFLAVFGGLPKIRTRIEIKESADADAVGYFVDGIVLDYSAVQLELRRQ